MANPSQQKYNKKLVRIREQLEVPPSSPQAAPVKVHIWITQDEHKFRLFLLKVALTGVAIMCVVFGAAISPKIGSLSLGVALAAAQFVGFFTCVRTPMLLHWYIFPRWVIAILDAGFILVVGVDAVICCILYLEIENGIRFGSHFTWSFVVVLAVLAGCVFGVDRRLSSADFEEFKGDQICKLALVRPVEFEELKADKNCNLAVMC
uniref:Uncharacterized protein n=1 Tax=Leersia perrieri TaxID=77586 RepID=A0A0D9V962_9ORYZ